MHSRFIITLLLSATAACDVSTQLQLKVTSTPNDSGVEQQVPAQHDAQTSVVDASVVSRPLVDSSGIHHLPDPALTPGALCAQQDPDFDGFRYPAHVAHCARNITSAMKDAVAKMYGIPKSDYSKYEFDHFIPLAIGGKNDVKNLWPQPLDEAHDKDRVEDEAYYGMKSGKLTQEQAVALIRGWRPSN